MEELFQLILKSYGIAGILILAPLAAAVYFWKDNRSLNKDLVACAKEHAKEMKEAQASFMKLLTEANDKVVAAQTQRVQDAQNISTKLMEIVSEQSSLNKETSIALDRLSETVSVLKGRQP